MNELKKTVFYGMLDLIGRVFIVVRYSDRVVIGARGFTEDEMKNGIVLVFNTKMRFSWDDSGISTSLVFGTAPHKCYIPADDIVLIYSPELNAQFMIAPQPAAETADRNMQACDRESAKTRHCSDHSKVVKVDFQKKKDRSR
ncbi:MAG TPA: ClpXP protease specificity-enhancing factor SspB [Thermodesulfovibrionales bacterium]|nr:ClpXP protease specificity-enhancing factor SspB [Thermodesulfovibrionales bacterium]